MEGTALPLLWAGALSLSPGSRRGPSKWGARKPHLSLPPQDRGAVGQGRSRPAGRLPVSSQQRGSLFRAAELLPRALPSPLAQAR